jgi:formylglycine-generating enzyme required for sulfatase activity
MQRLVKDGYFPAPLDAYATTICKLGILSLPTSGEKSTAAEVQRSLTPLQEVLKWYFEVEQPDAVGQVPALKPAGIKPVLPSRAAQPETKIAVVPKGLRSFDAQDAKFFLELLPGPRDENGLPESLRFWKHRIEASEELTYTVGVIYGPSGCGKSSLVKAGLLPRLAGQVISVYVEATADDTEARLLKGLRRRFPDLAGDLDLTSTIAALRQGQGQKVLIVIDQFEQWLHAKRGEENTELAQALRQCDGDHVQCIVMVRDDFWVALSRFMKELGIEVLPGQNTAMVDLFDLRHAKKVLTAFGQAFGTLPETLSKDQEAFLDLAVQGLAQEGRVISVRLALFAEMMKGKPWTTTTLKEVGGTEGIGVTFLEETFSASTAPPQHRLHQKAAQNVLKALLPESGTDIKGHMRSHAELLEASGYASRTKDFDDLLRILDSEIRLITPTDPEGKEGESSTQVQAGAKYYQLTHDYLVPSLRDWLTRKQKETRRGRAELLLADRAAVWNARPENRQLPSLWQWASIRWLTQKRNWTPPQRKMMRKASRYHAVRGLIVAVLLLAGSLIGFGVRSHVIEQENASHAAGLVKTLLNAKIGKVQEIIKEIDEYRTWADPLLKEANERTDLDAQKKLHISLALLPVDSGQTSYIYDRLLEAEPSEVSVLGDALAPHKQDLLGKLWAVVERPGQGKESQRLRAACALAKYDPDSQRWAKVQDQVANDLVTVPVVFSSIWIESLRDVRGKLQAPLAVIFKNGKRRETERSLATDIMADYAADQPDLLADLLMDADEKQFDVIYPKFKEQGERGLPSLEGELSKKVVTQNVSILSIKEIMTKKESPLKVEGVKDVTSLPAKFYAVKMKQGNVYTMTMASNEVEAFLVFQDATGKQLAFHDGGGGGKSAFLAFTVSNDDTYKVHAASYKGIGPFSLDIVEIDAKEDGKEKLAKRHANAAVALLRMNQPEKVWPLLKHSPDPRVRSYLIHRFGPLGADAGAIVKRLNEEPDVTIRRALILSLGEFEEKAWSADDRSRVTKNLQEIYRTAADPGVHAASEWLLRHWKHDDWLKKRNGEWAEDKEEREKKIEAIKQLLAKEKEKTPPQWYVNGQGQTMVVLPGPMEFVMGSPLTEVGRQDYEPQHKKRIGRTFALAAKSVTVEQYRKSNNKYQLPAIYTRTADLPVVGISWYQAAAYCNWLNEKEGIDPKEWCYEIKEEVTKLRENYLSLSGYRLPTEAEMEFATRAGAVTSRYFGETEELLPKYAWYTKNSQEKTWPVGSLKPNDLGLFDVQGNVFTWCQESYKDYPTGKGEEAAEDKEDGLVISPTKSRVLRGGSFFSRASLVRSADRGSYVPSDRNDSAGFRVARTLPLDGFTTLQPPPEGGGK